jgi:hypothetical protein
LPAPSGDLSEGCGEIVRTTSQREERACGSGAGMTETITRSRDAATTAAVGCREVLSLGAGTRRAQRRSAYGAHQLPETTIMLTIVIESP